MKRSIVLTALLLFIGCMASSTTTTAPMAAPAADIGAAIRANTEAFDAAMRAGNIDAFMAMYASDAVLMPPNAPEFQGTEAIRRFWSGLLAAGGTDVDLVAQDVYSSGDLAVERGHYELTKPFKDSGKYIVVWRNRSGKWQIVNDIFNSNLAPPQ